jgi:hypothetical protein
MKFNIVSGVVGTFQQVSRALPQAGVAAGLLLALALPSHAQWVSGTAHTDPLGGEISGGPSFNGGYSNGGPFSHDPKGLAIGHESVAHDASMQVLYVSQGSAWTEKHYMRKPYLWTGGDVPPLSFTIHVHGEISGARSGTYTNTNATSVINLMQQEFFLEGSANPVQPSYGSGTDREIPFDIYSNALNQVLKWDTYSKASGGRQSSFATYHAWAKTLFYTVGDAQ